MNTLTKFFNPLHRQDLEVAKYEVIENEVLKNSDFKDLTVSGSLFSLTTFVNVTFQSCAFFGSRFENCRFVNCKFIDCSFQFTTVEYCSMKNVAIKGCDWDLSPLKKCEFLSCVIDEKTEFFANKEDNKLESCEITSWDTERPEVAGIATHEESSTGTQTRNTLWSSWWGTEQAA